ncbi:MAG: SDR family oxidoreductase [Cytophagaceae bacterium]|jgi:NAD(P)-dependent dehydrogenase (short-subunit alcohol dehydrogenase family)|nr:SDR family oxidoreductase [Cytophagaceae bacterium]
MSKLELVAVITGASSGIGRAIAHEFSRQGAKLVLNGTNEAGLQETKRTAAFPERIRLVSGDIRYKATSKQLVDEALTHFTRVDIVINNAGVFYPKPFLEVEESDLQYFWEVNVQGAYFLSQAAIEAMLRSGGGSIINIGTVLVDHAIGGFPASAAVISKAALHTLSKQLAAEFGKQNIRVNTIAPGIIRSPLQAKIGVEQADSLAGLHLLHRIGEAEELASLVHAVALNPFVSGAIIPADGGHVAGHHLS